MRAVVVEDRASFAPTLARRLERTGVAVRCVAHGPLLANPSACLDDLGIEDLVLLDALDLGAQQDDPTASRLASLDVLDALATRGAARPRIVVYSTAMANPAVHLPLRDHETIIDGYFDVEVLHRTLEGIVRGQVSGGIPPPTATDFARLDPELPFGARVGAAHQAMRKRDRVWEQVWNRRAGFDRAAQRWITRNVLPLLRLPSSAGYGIAVDVVRSVAGLPTRGT